MSIIPNTNCAKDYKDVNEELRQNLPYYNAAPASSLLYYLDNNNLKINATKYENQSWVEPYVLSNYKQNTTTYITFVKKGSYPQFNSHLTTQGPGTYTLSISSNRLILKNSSNVQIFSLDASSFKDNTLPTRLFIWMQAGGGGGGSASGGTDEYPPLPPTPTIGGDGGGGGSGAYFAIVINTALLKQSSSNFYTFVVGAGGAGGSASWRWDATCHRAYGRPGGDGGDSYVRYNNTTFLIAKGGGGGGAPSPNSTTTQPGGAGGDVQDGNGTSLSNNHNPSQLSSWFWWIYTAPTNWSSDLGRSFDYGLKGGDSNGHSGSSTSSYLLAFTRNSSYRTNTLNYTTLGGYSGGGYHVNSAGGAASYFGNGGDGGWADQSTYYGKAGGPGAGGGGGRYHVYDAPSGGKGGDGFLDIWY